MDDYSINSLIESKNEWCARLVGIITFNLIEGLKSIFEESIKLCMENEEENKYLMTFQNLLSQIPSWNENTIDNERKRIEAVSKCKYLEDLITCVHIIQLKALSCIRVGQKQKKIDINIPSINKFIHQCYINSARKLYTNVYLFEKELLPLQLQKNNRELELLIKEAILITIRDNIPVEIILKAYMDETEELEDLEKDQHATDNVAKMNSVNDISGNIEEKPVNKSENPVSSILKKLDIKESEISNLSIINEPEKTNDESKKTPELRIQSPDITIDLTDKTHDTEDKMHGEEEKPAKRSLNFSDTSNVIDKNNKELLVEAKSPTLTSDKSLDSMGSADDSIQIGDSIENDMDIITLD